MTITKEAKKEAAESLRAAKKLISAGWVKRTYYAYVEGKHKYCAYGALEAADGPGEIEARKVLASVIKGKRVSTVGSAHAAIVNFNDNVETKKTDVLKMFSAAIKSLEEPDGNA